jgi:hypothetical protein
MSASEAPCANDRYASGTALHLLTDAFGAEIAWVWTAKARRGIYPLATKAPIRSVVQTVVYPGLYVAALCVQVLVNPHGFAHTAQVLAPTLAVMFVAFFVPLALYQRAYTAYGFDGRRAYIARGGVFPSATAIVVEDYTIVVKRRANGSGSIRFEEAPQPRRVFGPTRIAYAFVDVADVDTIGALLPKPA